MKKVRLSKEFHFEMGHALLNYDGLCRHIHGHSYKLIITVIGTPIADPLDPKLGMVLDFSDLKAAVKEPIVDHFDHSLIINKEAERYLPDESHAMYEKVHLLDFQPTCENLVLYGLTGGCSSKVDLQDSSGASVSRHWAFFSKTL